MSKRWEARRREGERGFALLLIFAMAAAVALLLYIELPRAVFESQRATEEMLIDRGEQYKTAIKRFYMKTKTYPDSIDQLEGTNGTRFLRRRYKDPFTNSTEWKIIKFGPAGELVDSVQSKKKGPLDKDEKGTTGSVVATASLADVQNPTEQGPQSLALSRRPSDQGIGAQLAQGQGGQQGAQGQTGAAGGPPPPPGSGSPNPYQQLPPSIPGVSQQQYQQLQQVLQQQQQQQQQQGQGAPPPIPNQLPFPQPGMGPLPGGLPGGIQQGGFPGGIPQQGPQAGPRPGFGQIPDPTRSAASSQTQQPGQSNQALNMINQILTNPQNRLQVGQPTGAQTPALAGKIAGFASKYKAEGIKVIEERTKINEWEFIYDFRKDKSLTGGMGGAQMPNQNTNPLGGSGLSNTGFGNSTGTGSTGIGSPGVGSSGTGSTGSGRGTSSGTRRQ